MCESEKASTPFPSRLRNRSVSSTQSQSGTQICTRTAAAAAAVFRIGDDIRRSAITMDPQSRNSIVHDRGEASTAHCRICGPRPGMWRQSHAMELQFQGWWLVMEVEMGVGEVGFEVEAEVKNLDQFRSRHQCRSPSSRSKLSSISKPSSISKLPSNFKAFIVVGVFIIIIVVVEDFFLIVIVVGGVFLVVV